MNHNLIGTKKYQISIGFLKLFFLISIGLSTQNAIAQTSTDIQKEIDTQVWKPFKAAFEGQDGKALNDLYAEEVLRVTPVGIDTEGAFKKANLERFDGRKKEGVTIALDFWFDSRKTNETTSYEVGIFRITSVTSGIENVFYGQFHIVMKKVNNSWKITQDWDTEEINGRKINAGDFARNLPARF